ncbi:MAG: class I SAM-dependent methyltransferase [Xanthomonadales bacterium]|nr:class I SAM-dependent methyltransferase [Xanthomonadales bacterium]
MMSMQESATNYQQFWNSQAGSPESALAAVDGSGDETITRATGQWSAKQVRAALDLRETDTVLELGCGVARIGRELAPQCKQWVGVDISSNMLRSAAHRLKGLQNTELHALNRTQLEMLEDERFDKAYCVAVFCHMDKEDFFLYMKELWRVLKPAGMIYFETWNMDHPVGWKRWQFEVDQWSRADHSQRKDVARNQFSVPQEVDLFTRRAGFEPLACFGNSPWVQMLAVKPATHFDRPGALEHIERHRDVIEVSQERSELFGDYLDVVYGLRHPREVLSEWQTRPETENVYLYRLYLEGLWRAGAGRWGELDNY